MAKEKKWARGKSSRELNPEQSLVFPPCLACGDCFGCSGRQSNECGKGLSRLVDAACILDEFDESFRLCRVKIDTLLGQQLLDLVGRGIVNFDRIGHWWGLRLYCAVPYFIIGNAVPQVHLHPA